MVLKKQYFDANFPKDSDNATYHVGTKRGEVAARIVCVGDPTRAKVLASSPDFKLVFQKTSKRGFTTYTGYYKGTPISVVATGMGFPMADFFVRECRAVVDGPMLIVRFGSCGGISDRARVGYMAVATKCINVIRNVDYFSALVKGRAPEGRPYLISQPVDVDVELLQCLTTELRREIHPARVIACMNATACSFYSSQGRTDEAFTDENASLIDDIRNAHEECETLEMETFQLVHLAHASATRHNGWSPSIRAAACTMVFAGRTQNEFISPADVEHLERVAGTAVLDAIVACSLDGEV
ncbi:hypothetical protein SeLEV6574_g06243, partial [Synchytrium endobioticum]